MFKFTGLPRVRPSGRAAMTPFIVGLILAGTTVVIAPISAGASGSTNTFTFKGAHSGTLKLSPSSLTCSYGKAYSGGGYQVNLNHMTGTITGAGKGEWALGVYPTKKGTTTVAKANVNSITDSSFQSNATPIIQFVETSGSVTYHGATGSIDMTFAYHPVGSQTYTGTTTVSGSWNCNA
ncbi:MAG: hypothetical protein WAN30_02480 [Acidimicrobiales bacterium]